MEVRRGILDREESKGRAICFVRDIQEFSMMNSLDLSQTGTIGRYIELGNAEGLEADMERQNNITRVRQSVKDRGIQMEEFKVDWSDKGIQEDTHSKYMKKFGDKFYKHMKDGITDGLQKRKQITNSFVTEPLAHGVFCSKRADNFFGRSDLIEAGLQYFKKSEKGRKPLVLHGISGAGKTSLVSALALKSRELFGTEGRKPTLVVRFCGTTPQSCSGRQLMYSICMQINYVYDPKFKIVPPFQKDFKQIKKTFPKMLRMASKERPLIVFIDSLDQLDNNYNERSEPDWIPMELPEHCYVVVSTLPDIGDCYQALRQMAIPEENYLEVKCLVPEDAEDILNGWLQKLNRTLQVCKHVNTNALTLVFQTD